MFIFENLQKEEIHFKISEKEIYNARFNLKCILHLEMLLIEYKLI